MSQQQGIPDALCEKSFHYCPGCTHGIIHRIIAEVIDELAIREKTICVGSVGCSVLTYEYFNVDAIGAAHGRACAVATGIKRALPDRVVFTYQGDGDLASIGIAEAVHAAIRGEKITAIFVNNALYAMTGGQCAPTTVLGQKTTTTPFGRHEDREGYPVNMTEMLAPLKAPAYLARVSVHQPSRVMQAKKYIKKAFATQIGNAGFSMVEVLSTCPTNWGLEPVEALNWVESHMLPNYPLGEFKLPEGVT